VSFHCLCDRLTEPSLLLLIAPVVIVGVHFIWPSVSVTDGSRLSLTDPQKYWSQQNIIHRRTQRQDIRAAVSLAYSR
jgi:hypothetical protein